MAKIYLVGGNQVTVSKDKAEKLLAMKQGVDSLGNKISIDKDRLIDIGQKDFITIAQVKRIDFEEGDALDEIGKEKWEERERQKKEHNLYIEECRKQDPETKAKRMIQTGCLILFKARFNKSKEISGELYDQLMIALIEFFEKNPTEWWAEGKEYQYLIPHNQPPIVSNVPGWQSVGEATQEKFEI